MQRGKRASHLLCVAPLLPSRRLRELEVHRAYREAAWSHKTFEDGTWGGEIRREFAAQPGDIMALEHWCSSGFANTDLDLQLKKHGIHQAHRHRAHSEYPCGVNG